MAKKPDVIETWRKLHPKTKKPMYYFHRLYANGNKGDSEKFSSRSGRSKKIRKIKALEPTLVVRAKAK